MRIETPASAEATSPAERLPSATHELDRSLIRGIAWTGGVKTATQLLSWVSTLVVAHLLSPTDYGISGMAMVYIGFVQLVNEFGLSAAVVQRQDLTDDQIAKLGGLSILLGAVICALSISLSPLIARFFDQRALTAVVIVLSTTFLTSAFQVLPRSLLTRELRFRELAALEGMEALAGTVLTLTLAILGMGYWALVVGAVAGRITSTIFALLWRHHRLSWPFPLTTIGNSVAFGSHVAASAIAWYIFRSADMTIVGKRLGEVALGTYTLGWTLASLPVDRVSALVARATPAIFARVQNEPASLRRYVVILTEALAFVAMPMAVGLAVVADDAVLVVLGENWREAIVPLRLLALAAVFRSTIPILNQVLVATGQARRSMQGTIGVALILPALFFVASYWGTPGVALVWVVAFPLVSYPLYMRHALKACELPLAGYVKALWPALSGVVVMAAVVLLVRQQLPPAKPLIRLVVQIVAGASSYGAVIFALHRRRVETLLSTVRSLR